MATKITFLTYFRLGVELVRDAACFFGKLYYWFVTLSEYTIVPLKQIPQCHYSSCFENSWLLGNNRKLQFCLTLSVNYKIEYFEHLRVIIYKHQNFPIEARNDMSQNCLKLCVFLSYVK